MKTEERILALTALGKWIKELSEDEFQSIAEEVRRENPWFTESNVRMAVSGVASFLDEEKLRIWTSTYTFRSNAKKVALILAGNIPMVGFHDLLCVLISGHHAQIKLSSKDSVLIKFLIHKLISIEPQFETQIEWVERLKNFDAVIATGSDNSARYFDYYFGKYPNIIRKNRTSIAVLTGNESEHDLNALGLDVFSYFGLGCRNVSKLFVPAGYDLGNVYRGWESYHDIVHHHKYCNNYDYQKSILLVNISSFLDNGFAILQENEKMVSPISVIYYEFYNSTVELNDRLNSIKEKVQCIVGDSDWATIKFGQSQFPELGDYADQIDTLLFLSQLA
ncbi:MAG TPA: acyl-CoA reductase [Chryseolinea sp.]|nr:acyl-CoA reductase [Chryseolinea sp.]HPM32918.1 acyl-CoA reductase [Chryseolinea sp.]